MGLVGSRDCHPGLEYQPSPVYTDPACVQVNGEFADYQKSARRGNFACPLIVRRLESFQLSRRLRPDPPPGALPLDPAGGSTAARPPI